MYDWDLITVPQLQLDGGTRTMPQGKVLGGGSILNAMCWNRGGQDDYNAWESLGNPGWGWDGLLPYFQKVRCVCAESAGTTDILVIERNLYPGSFPRDCPGVLDQLQSCSTWLLRSGAGQLPKLPLSSVQYVQSLNI